MTAQDFFSSPDLQKLITDRKVDVNKEKHDREQALELYMKYGNEQLHQVHIGKKHVTEEQFRNVELSQLYPNDNTITQQKYKDLMVLMQFLLPRCKAVVKNIVC